MTFSSVSDFDRALATLPEPDCETAALARMQHARLAEPQGSLGRLEELAIFFAGWQRRELPFIARGHALIFAGSHGFAASAPGAAFGPNAKDMVANCWAGGAAINALTNLAEIELDVRALELDRPTADFTQAPAMTQSECLAALSAGAAAVDRNADLIVLGEIGIGNAIAAAALCAHSLGGSGADWIAASPGSNPDALARQISTADAALALHADMAHTPFETLRRLGGREIAAIAGTVIQARQLRIPVVLDSFACAAALAPLFRHRPDIVEHCMAGHCSAEPGHARLLERLGLMPLLRLGLRIGSGNGAALAVGLIRSALAAHSDMAPIAEAPFLKVA